MKTKLLVLFVILVLLVGVVLLSGFSFIREGLKLWQVFLVPICLILIYRVWMEFAKLFDKFCPPDPNTDI